MQNYKVTFLVLIEINDNNKVCLYLLLQIIITPSHCKVIKPIWTHPLPQGLESIIIESTVLDHQSLGVDLTAVVVLQVVGQGHDVVDRHLGLHDVDLLLTRGRQQVDLLHPGLVDTVEKGERGIYELEFTGRV